MPNYGISPKWEKAKTFKDPFHYVIGKGEISDEDAETYEGEAQLVQIVRLDMSDLLKLGMAEELDFMSKALILPDKTPEDSETATQSLGAAIKKAENFSKMEEMINKIVHRGVLNPHLYEIPEHENARQKGLYYIDIIPFDDRMELFSVIFETEGLSDFRQEQEVGVGDMADVPSVSLPADEPVAELRPSDSEGVLL